MIVIYKVGAWVCIESEDTPMKVPYAAFYMSGNKEGISYQFYYHGNAVTQYLHLTEIKDECGNFYTEEKLDKFIEDINKTNFVTQIKQDPLLLSETYRLRSSELTTQMDLKQLHDNLPLFYDSELVNGATIVHDNTNSSSTISTTNSGDAAVFQTRQRGNYPSGKPAEVLQSFSKFDTVAGQEIRIGYFSSSTTTPFNTGYDGYFLASIDGVVSFQVWRSGVLNVSVDQADWNDPLDGTGESTKVIDWSKVQLMRTTFLWLGVDSISLYLKIEGNLYKVHEMAFGNLDTEVFMTSPNQPIRCEVRQTGATPIEFMYVCAAFGIDGARNVLGITAGADDNGTHLNANNTNEWYYAIGVRLQAGKEDTLIDILGGSLLSVTNDNFLFRVLYNPTYSGTVTYNDITNYSASIGLGATANTITDDGTILISGSGAQVTVSQFILDNAKRLGSGIDGTLDELVIAVKPLTSNLDIHRSINFRQQT